MVREWNELSNVQRLVVQELEELYDQYHPDGMTVGELELSAQDAADARGLFDYLIQQIWEIDT